MTAITMKIPIITIILKQIIVKVKTAADTIVHLLVV
jgi:hypothetical protein